MLLVLYKPFGVLSQFTEEVAGQRTLAEFGFPGGVYPVGRLDADSEGMLLLSDEAGMADRLLDPKRGHWRRYLAQVEGEITAEATASLSKGVVVRGRMTLPARAERLEDVPNLPERVPGIRVRKAIPTSWMAVELREGRNRQVRRMTAAVGFPTLRLVRVRIGRFAVPSELRPGDWRELEPRERESLFEPGQ
ncbi:MAG: pseudouridine synthase [Chthoniobacterales bacterium]